MSAVILDGKATAQKIKTNLIKRVQDLKTDSDRQKDSLRRELDLLN